MTHGTTILFLAVTLSATACTSSHNNNDIDTPDGSVDMIVMDAPFFADATPDAPEVLDAAVDARPYEHDGGSFCRIFGDDSQIGFATRQSSTPTPAMLTSITGNTFTFTTASTTVQFTWTTADTEYFDVGAAVTLRSEGNWDIVTDTSNESILYAYSEHGFVPESRAITFPGFGEESVTATLDERCSVEDEQCGQRSQYDLLVSFNDASPRRYVAGGGGSMGPCTRGSLTLLHATQSPACTSGELHVEADFALRFGYECTPWE